MACPCTFEPVIQVDCLFDVIGIVRSGGLADQKADILEHCGCAVGSLGAYLKSNGDSENIFGDHGSTLDPVATPAPQPSTIEECCDLLEAQLQLVQGVHGERKISPEAWALIIKLVELIMKFL